MSDRYRLVLVEGQYFYAFDKQLKKKTALNTQNRAEAERLLQAMNESHKQPFLNSAIAKVYLSAQDPMLVKRTWEDVMNTYAVTGKGSTRERTLRAMKSKPFHLIRKLALIDTTQSHLQAVLSSGGTSTNNYLRRLHNLAVKEGWLLQPVMPPAKWPRMEPVHKRAITEAEHRIILEDENDPERKLYYSMLWETGGAQSDVADLSWENVNFDKKVLVYHRKKTGEKCQLSIGQGLAELLLKFPQSGYFFPKWRLIEPKHRAAEFRRRCRVAGIKGVSLHCYRYAWAQRAFAAGYPERFAQAALGHKSKAIHNAYARNADVVCPPLDYFETKNSFITHEREELFPVCSASACR